MTMTARQALFAISASLLVAAQPASAATEVLSKQDSADRPGAAAMLLDATVARPLQLGYAVLSTGLFVVTLPISAVSQSVKPTADTLVAEPWQALTRCLGCTPAQDAAQRARNNVGN